MSLLEQRAMWPDREPDAILAEYFSNMCMQGAAANMGSHTIAAISHFTPGLPRQAATLLPRASRAMQAWKRRAPALTRLPIPRAAMISLGGVLISWRQAPMAAWLAICFSGYLRPAGARRLTADSIVQPSEMAGAACQFRGLLLHPAERRLGGKTGPLDESILFDHDQCLAPVLIAPRSR
ncbi:unnamed protein product, partial [Prorocentrum cordatum]